MTLVEKATVEIRGMIAEKRYDSDGYLPSEGVLSEKLEVSRATIREAVRSLEVRGLVQRIHGKGIKVVDNAMGTMTQTLSDILYTGNCTVRDLIEVRHVIETAAARLACERAKAEHIRNMQEAIEAMEAAQTMDEDYLNADLRFHLAMAEGTCNPVLNAIVEAYTPLLADTIRATTQGDGVIEREYHFHRNILDAIMKRDSTAAAQAVEQHLIATEVYSKS